MYRKLLFVMVLCNAAGFNIQISPVKHFTNEDPLFGQTIIQAKDGIFVPSPTYGRLFKCTLDNECTKVNINDENPKGMRPVASVASLTSQEQHVVMCNQVRTENRGTEYLNGICTLVSPSGKVKLYPAELDNNKNNNNNNNNNNNKYQGGRINQGPGTEIAFVLDGSGSIQDDDFQKAKDFIYNVMSNVWKTCFDCNFAIVQYGSLIRTELSLLDNEDRVGSLLKVKQIKQIYNLTKTASAINHVLTDIFIPENGSKDNSAKIIIVLSDGKILGDPMTLDEVLNKPQMKGVTRYSIGVGDGILKNLDATEEMMQIADPGKYYNVSSYRALNDIVSSLERGIIGTKDPGTEIAFVLDGSGSIQDDDFQKAKDFIYNVMSNVWKTCFDCNFAIVQYGSLIRTELLLLDNEDRAGSLLKVKQIKQIYNLTKTASAINHVLTDIFIPEKGSKNNTAKIIIVLSDGEILEDPMTLDEVLNKPQMKGVTRYSIGVGDGILKKPNAVKEMMQIADPGKYYSVSSYGALNDILSSLEREIIGTEAFTTARTTAARIFDVAACHCHKSLLTHQGCLNHWCLLT
ncbi:cartilage matrix protein isoform X1 [Danio rerio]|uniref:Cartilage matrix protein isoform X1 n=1 Tax=Danio rerio TaxID=7955 RepID=A0AB32T5M2_DANRE